MKQLSRHIAFIFKNPYLLAYFVIFIVLWSTKGMTHPNDMGFPYGTGFLILVFIFLLWVSFKKPKMLDGSKDFHIELILFIQFVLFTVANLSHRYSIYHYTKETSYLFVFNILFYLAFAIYILSVLVKKQQLLLIKICLAVCILFSISVIFCSIDSGIDTHLFLNLASDHFLQFENPYNYNYPDIYNGQYSALYGNKYYFNYWPIALYICSVFRLLFGDIRYAFVFAQFVFVFLLIRYRNKLSLKNAMVVSVLWLSNLVILFINERGWLDALVAPFFLGALLLLKNKKFFWAAVLIGLMASIKLYYIFALPFFGIYYLKEKKFKEIVVMGLALVSTFIPFLIMSFDNFYYSTIVFINNTKVRVDSLSLISAIQRISGVDVSSWGMIIMFLFMGIFIAIFAWRKNNLLNIVKYINLTFFAIFLFSKQSFCNYFYFNMLCAFIIFYLEANFDHEEKEQHGVHI